MLKEIQLGIGTYFEAHAFIRKHKLWLFVLLPGIINLILISILIASTWDLTAEYTTMLVDWTGIENQDWGWFSWLYDALYFFMLLLFRIIILFLYFKIYKYIVLTIMAPVMAYISEKSEELLTSRTYPFEWKTFLNNVFRGVGLAIRNFAIEIGLTILIFSLSFIPVASFSVPVLLFFVEGYFYGFSMMDYYNERQELGTRESRRFVWRHKGLALANGGVFVALLLIPILGVMIAPTYSVIAATLAMEKLKAHNEG